MCLVLLPWTILLVDPNWIFNDLYNDPWIYFGYFLNLPNHLRSFENLYYSDRMSVLVPGYLCHQIFPDLAAHCVLHLSLYYVTIFSIYWLLRASVGHRAGFLATLAAGLNYYLLKAIGWDYLDGFVITYFSAMAFLLEHQSRSKQRVACLLLAGTAGAAALLANIAFTPFLFAYVGVWLASRISRGIVDAISDLGLLLAGAGILMVIMQIIWLSTTDRFWTFQGTRLLLSVSARVQEMFRVPASEWVGSACWLVFPILVVVMAVMTLAKLRPFRLPDPVARFALNELIFGLIALSLYGHGDRSFVRLFFYTSLVLPVCFLAFGVFLQGMFDDLTESQYTLVAVVAFVGLFAPHVIMPIGVRTVLTAPLPLAVALATGFLALAATWLRRPFPRCIVFFLFLSLSLGVAGYGFTIESCLPRADLYQTAGMRNFDRDRTSVTRIIAAATRCVLAVDPTGNMCFWYNLRDPLGLIFKAIGCTHLDGPRVVSLEFPETDCRTSGFAYTGDKPFIGRWLSPGCYIAVLTSSPNTARIVEAARRSLHRCDLTARAVLVQRFVSGRFAFTMIIMRLE